jgi:hypothetical protein
MNHISPLPISARILVVEASKRAEADGLGPGCRYRVAADALQRLYPEAPPALVERRAASVLTLHAWARGRHC